MKRIQRLGGAVLAATLATAGLAVVTTSTASAAIRGQVTVNPASGNHATIFSGTATTDCPADSQGSLFTLEGPNLDPFQAFLGNGTATGDGAQSFVGASIANLKTNNAGSFTATSVYRIVFSCINGAGAATDTYEANLNYTFVSATAGTYTITPATVAVVSRASATTLTAAPSTVESGSSVDLTADVTPTTGADNATGSVEFFNGTTSLGVDNTLTANGVATLATSALPVGVNGVTAVFTPAAGSGLTGSTSPVTTVTVTAVAARPTTASLTASPVSGSAYQAVTLTCTVNAGTFQANGTASFTNNGAFIGSAPVTAGAPAVLTTSAASAPGAHDYVCNFVGTAPYTNSTSNTVTASFTQAGAVPDEQTVTVTIPGGVIVITTPYTPQNPLYLGVAVLDPATSTYSAAQVFNGITVTDSRAGNLGFTASVIAGDFINGPNSFSGAHAGFTNVAAQQVPGNAMQASNVVPTNTVAFAPGIGTQRTFATYAAGLPTGSVNMTATFSIAKVPTSVQPGLYTSTVTFTAV